MDNPSLSAFRSELYGPKKDPSSFVVSPMVGTSLPWAQIPIPHVKEVVKAHWDDDALPLESFLLDESVELTLCYFLLSLRKEGSFEKQMGFLQGKIRYANSWMITDALPQAIKKAPLESFHPYYSFFVRSKDVYARRFAYVFALRYYREKDLAFLLGELRYDQEYYVTMAQAWLLATLGISHFEEIVSFLQKPSCPKLLFQKSISKMRDSFRISPEHKEILKRIRDNR